jgi:PAS domain S-box-containing protein
MMSGSQHGQQVSLQRLEFLNKAIESISVAIGVSDAKGNHIYQNKALSDLFGYKKAEELQAAGGGKAVVKDPSVATEMFDAIMNGKSWKGELEMVTKSGRVIPCYEYADAIMDEKGTIIGLIGIITDRTEWKATQNQLNENARFNESLLNLIQEVIYIYDFNEKKNVYCNKGIETVLGYSVEEIRDMGERMISLLMHPEDFIVYTESVIPRYKTAKDKEQISSVYRMKHKNGQWVWLESTETIYRRQADGVPVQIFGVIRDITNEKQMLEMLKLKLVETEKTNALMVNRELRMVELKKQIKDLEFKLQNKG